VTPRLGIVQTGRVARFLVVAAGVALLVGGCTTTSKPSASAGQVEPADPGVPVYTGKSEVIATPSTALVPQTVAVSPIAPGYSPFEIDATTVAFLLKGESEIEVFDTAESTVASQTIKRFRTKSLPFVAIGNTPDRLLVQLPTRPNGATGWIDRTKVELLRNDYRLEVSLSKFSMAVFEKNIKVRDIPIGIGTDETPTPDGVYYTYYTGRPKTPDTVYGAFVIGLSGFSEIDSLTQQFAGSQARLGLHGTNAPEKLGDKISKGCIRMKNDDVTFLIERLPLGTPVKVSA
jgi:lipoprotein-anchoring transpeptidase ErfK/SrfK